MSFALFMDVSILVLLAATVFLAGRLTFSLRNFNESRSEMQGLINRLTGNVDKAERAIAGMQNAARNAGKELDEIISEAKSLSDELKFMNETGDNLANRLEKLAEKNRELINQMEEAGKRVSMPITYNQPGMAKPLPRSMKEEPSPAGFAIQDRDFDDDMFEDSQEDDFGLQSQAERELFEALQNNKSRHRKAAGGKIS